MKEHVLTELQIRLLDVFKRVVRVLDNNNLTWWTDGGTTIGTIRHQGFIPWDDDIDIMMPYKDYARLLKMNEEFSSMNLAIDIPFGDNNCCSYAKIYDTNSTVWQSENQESIIGLWIDVFPMFRSNMTLDEYKKCKKKYTKLNDAYILGKQKLLFSDFLFLIKGLHIKNLFRWFAIPLYYKRVIPCTINRLKDIIDNLDDPSGQYFIFPYSYFDRINRFPIEWFHDTIRMPFEDIAVNVISGYDSLLKQQFGDYMKLPPEEKRISTHSFYFIDLGHRYEKDEIKQLKKMKKNKMQ